VNYPVGRERRPITPPENALLSVRQREMFELTVIGQSNKAIARNIGVSESTVNVALAGAKIGFFPRN